MALNAVDLAKDIGDALKSNAAVGGAAITTNGDAREAIDASIDKMAESIAEAVVKNIKDNLIIIDSNGSGNQGIPVLSKSLLKVGLEVV